MKKRIISTEVLKRVRRTEEIIYERMINSNNPVTRPELCIEVLVSAGVYEFDSKNKAHFFREDLRNLRENNKLDEFTKISISQESPGKPWIIKII